MIRILVAAILGAFLFLFFGLVIIEVQSKFPAKLPSGTGYLSVHSNPANEIVSIDGETIGVTPIDRLEINSGIHVVRVGKHFHKKINVLVGLESKIDQYLTAHPEFSYGYSIDYERRPGLFSPKQGIQVVTLPPDAQVQIDDQDVQGESPSLIEEVGVGNHLVSITKPGYKPDRVEVEVSQDLIVDLEIEMQPSLIDDAHKIPLSDNDLLDPVSQEQRIIRRFDWGGNLSSFSDQQPKIAHWEKLEVWGTEADIFRLEPDFILNLDIYLQETRSLPAIPYAYLVDEQGNIYEGLGIRDYSFDQLSGFEFLPGVAPVLIFNSQGDFLDVKVKQSLTFLKQRLEQMEELSGVKITELGELELVMGERREITLTWQNTSSTIWSNQSSNQIWLVWDTQSLEGSELYDPVSWVSDREISKMIESQVLPGDIATVKFAIQAPYYPLITEEKLKLKNLSVDMSVVGSEVKLLVKVVGNTQAVLRIKTTPTGFLHVRSGPGVAYDLLTTVYDGEKYGAVGQEGGWWQIILRDGTKGWIVGQYVEIL